jgi:hypothetical protein
VASPLCGDTLCRLASGGYVGYRAMSQQKHSFERLSFEIWEPFQRTVFQKKVLRRLEHMLIADTSTIRQTLMVVSLWWSKALVYVGVLRHHGEDSHGGDLNYLARSGTWHDLVPGTIWYLARPGRSGIWYLVSIYIYISIYIHIQQISKHHRLRHP